MDLGRTGQLEGGVKDLFQRFLDDGLQRLRSEVGVLPLEWVAAYDVLLDHGREHGCICDGRRLVLTWSSCIWPMAAFSRYKRIVAPHMSLGMATLKVDLKSSDRSGVDIWIWFTWRPASATNCAAIFRQPRPQETAACNGLTLV